MSSGDPAISEEREPMIPGHPAPRTDCGRR